MEKLCVRCKKPNDRPRLTYCSVCAAKKQAHDSSYQERNREKIRDRKRAYYQSHKERLLRRSRAYAAMHRKELSAHHRERMAGDLDYRLRIRMRTRLCQAIRQNSKAGSAISDLGCSLPEFKKYIEDRFEPGMSWENWGRKTWHLDHVKPLSRFDLTDRAQFLEACHYTNLQPLWAKENGHKHASQAGPL